MVNSESSLQDKIRQQFETAPYFNVPLERSPKKDALALYFHNLVTPYYIRNQQAIATEGKIILDAGCGSGYKSLVLALANPGAKIVGIDFSEESVKLARQRLQYHGIQNAFFYTLKLEELSSLGMEFDYINCDEVLYLLPDLEMGLRAIGSVLKPNGIIRTNLHSAFQRQHYFRAQSFFQMLGFMEGSSQTTEVQFVRETMRNLKDNVFLKTVAWKPEFETDDERIRSNHLLQGDKGYTIPEMFAALKAAGLEFISMVQWQQWDLLDLFEDLDELPVFLAMRFAQMSVEQRLHAHELLQSAQRLLDFWCGHPDEGRFFVPVEEWTESQWRQAQVHLHPQLKTPELQQELIASIRQMKSFDLHRHLPITGEPAMRLDSSTATCILPLLETSHSMMSLVERWQRLHPLNPLTLEPIAEPEAFEAVKQMLAVLWQIGYILLES